MKRILTNPLTWFGLAILLALGYIYYQHRQHKKELDAEKNKYRYSAVENANKAMYDSLLTKIDKGVVALHSLDSNYRSSLVQQSLIIKQFHSLYGEIDKAANDNDTSALWGIIRRLCAEHEQTPVARYR